MHDKDEIVLGVNSTNSEGGLSIDADHGPPERFQDDPLGISPSERSVSRSEVLKTADTFAVIDGAGTVTSEEGMQHGVYHKGTRYISQWELLINSHRPVLLDMSVAKDNSSLVVQMTTADVRFGDGQILPHGSLHLARTLRVLDGKFVEEVRLANYSAERIELAIDYRLNGDFADIFEIRGAPRRLRGTKSPEIVVSPTSLAIEYHGVDGKDRTVTFEFDGRFDSPRARNGRFTGTLSLSAGEVCTYTARASLSDSPGASGVQLRPVSTESDDGDWNAEIMTSNERCNEWISRSRADLAMLTTETVCGPFPYAGVPWFSTPFGRDALITALQTVWIMPDLARGTLRFLAAKQANEIDYAAEAEPGKIFHETRDGEMAATGEVPFLLYYGTVDATPLFVMLAGAYYRRTGDLKFIRTIWSNIGRAIAWIDEYGDCDGDGFVEYQSHSATGLLHQCWKDSHDSIFHSDGRDAPSPIAVAEVQGYVYDAKLAAAEIARALGEDNRAEVWEMEAKALKRRFNESFWSSPIQTFAIALDGDKRPCEVRTSNTGHLLYCGIVDEEFAEPVARSLMSNAAFNGWGVRTVFDGEPRYNPMSYHNGSVWPHDTSIAAAGLARYGFKEQASTILAGLYDAALASPIHRLPELFCGFERTTGFGPTPWPVACSPQAWACGACFLLLQSVLGLTFSPHGDQIKFTRPMLPEFLQRVHIRNLRVPGGVAEVVLHRHRRDVGLQVERKEGDFEIVVVS